MGQLFSRDHYRTTKIDIAKKCNSNEFRTIYVERMPDNPGSCRDFNRDFRELIPVDFSGVKVDLCKTVSSKFRVLHSILLNTDAHNEYKFGVEFCGSNKNPKLVGNVTPDGIVNGCFLYKFGQFQLKLATCAQSCVCKKTEFCLDHLSCDGTTSFNFSDIDIIENKVNYSIQNYRKLADRLFGGFEVFGECKWDNVDIFYDLNFVAKYLIENGYLASRFSKKEVQLNYFHNASARMKFGIEFYRNFSRKDTYALFAYQFDLKEDDFVYKVIFGTNGIVAGTIEKKLCDFDYRLIIGGQINYLINKFSIGIGLRIGDC